MNKLAPEPHHEPQLKRHQSWLAISLAAPRRLLSSIQARQGGVRLSLLLLPPLASAGPFLLHAWYMCMGTPPCGFMCV